jgi:hypothetical protein
MHAFPGSHKRVYPHLSDRAGVSQQQSTLIASLSTLVKPRVIHEILRERGLAICYLRVSAEAMKDGILTATLLTAGVTGFDHVGNARTGERQRTGCSLSRQCECYLPVKIKCPLASASGPNRRVSRRGCVLSISAYTINPLIMYVDHVCRILPVFSRDSRLCRNFAGWLRPLLAYNHTVWTAIPIYDAVHLTSPVVGTPQSD